MVPPPRTRNAGPGLLSAVIESVATARWFHRAVIITIVANGVLLGLETSRGLVARWGPVFAALHLAISAFFVVEIALRLAASGRDLRRFLSDGWNLFDVVIVTASLLPQVGPLALVARLARLVRVARMVSILPELRLLVGTMLRSLGSLGHIVVLLGLIGYCYALVGVSLFRDVDPEHWGSLGRAGLTLFEVVTLEGWADLQAAVIREAPWAWVYFASFIVLAVFVVINLFIAVVVNNLEKTKAEVESAITPRGRRSGGISRLAPPRRPRRTR